MSLNRISLPASLISELYTSSLVGAKETDADFRKQSSTESEWNYIGKNEKNILLLVNYTDQKELNSQQFSFLNNMLTACKIRLSDIVLMNLSQNSNADYKNLQEHFNSRIIFLFGIAPSSLELPLSFPPFQVQTFANCTFLFTPALEELENDKLLKSKLWVCLRRIFSI